MQLQPQGRALHELVSRRAPLTIVEIVISEGEILRRLAARMILLGECRHQLAGGRSRHYVNCVDCGGNLVPRLDDAEEVVRKRLEVYHRQTAPLIEGHPTARPTLHRRVDGAQLADRATEDILNSVASSRAD